MNRILIVEDERPISNLMKITLQKAGYKCSCVYDGRSAIDMVNDEHFDLILLDIMLPEIDGYEVLEYIRSDQIPVIFVTAKAGLSDRVRGLNMGAEDYIVKPFEVLELLARVEVVLRRYKKTNQSIYLAGLNIDTSSMRVCRDDELIPLTPKEYDLLLFFARNPQIVLYRESIYRQVWGGELPYGSKTVDLHIQRLRKKLGWTTEIQAVSKVGYRLEVGKTD